MDWFETRENKTKPQNQQQRILPFAAGLALGGAGAYAYGASMKTRKEDKQFLAGQTDLINEIQDEINKCINSVTDGGAINGNLLKKCIEITLIYIRLKLDGKGTINMNPEDVNLLMHYEIIPRDETYSQTQAIRSIRLLSFSLGGEAGTDLQRRNKSK